MIAGAAAVSLWPSVGGADDLSELARIHRMARTSALAVTGARSQARRVVAERRRYGEGAGDPHGYFHDILGWALTPQQEDALDTLHHYDRVLLPSGNNLGKTFLLSGYGVYRMDAVAALPDPDRDLEEQGAQILLPGPDEKTILGTLYSAMLEHAARAEMRGHLMPGERSEKSVLWRVRPLWFVEAFHPPTRVEQNVAHTASGRHHRNQIALIEEGQGVLEAVWRGAEGMCSSAGNKIASSFNPTEPSGPAYARARAKTYRVHHLSALDHPNVRERRLVIPSAVDFAIIDTRVRAECQDRGPVGAVPEDPAEFDFRYALPPLDADGEPAPERGARTDGELGHADGRLRVYRPGATFTAQVLGRWPRHGNASLFEPGALDAAVERWKDGADPDSPPDAVGVDPAREGADDTCVAPRWGEGAETLLRAYAQASSDGPRALAAVQARRQRVGTLRLLPKGDGPATAARVRDLYPRSPFHVDEGGVGASVLDHLSRVLKRQAVAVSFAASPPEPTPGEPWSEAMRTAMYVRAARMVALGLVDVPDDETLREELLAHTVRDVGRTVTETVNRRAVKVRKESLQLVEKAVVRRALGRSPDRADAFVLAVNDFAPLPPPPVHQHSFVRGTRRAVSL